MDKPAEPDLYLTPIQQSLLRNALSSNNRSSQDFSQSFSNGSTTTVKPTDLRSNSMPQRTNQTRQPSHQYDIYESSTQPPAASAALSVDGFEESPFLDYNLDDGNFDWDNNGQLIGTLPEAGPEDDADQHDKRKVRSSDDDDEDEDGGGKRREGDEKTSKKPGRKPLTSEPTTKRKAQNRAAQRAFRERKERHLKELETKVEDLEKASEATNHENGILRAQVERLNTEVKEYRKRMVLATAMPNRPSPPNGALPQSNTGYNLNKNDFQFAFPKFGDLPSIGFAKNSSLAKPVSPTRVEKRSRFSGSDLPAAIRKSSSSSTMNSAPGASQQSPNQSARSGSYDFSTNGSNGIVGLNGLFSPSILETINRSDSKDYMSYDTSRNGLSAQKSYSLNSGRSQSFTTNGESPTSIMASPATSLLSHNGISSSCNTTPEPSAEMPDNRKMSEGSLHTINEEHSAHSKIQDQDGLCKDFNQVGGNKSNPVPPMIFSEASAQSQQVKTPSSDLNGIDWMAQQNGGQFDPVLFGDYRDPQDNILNNGFGDFFSDAFPLSDFASPFMEEVTNPASAPKREPTKEIEAQQPDEQEVVSANKPRQFISCDKLWNRVHNSEKVISGEIDMDSLCSQLKAKAKCGGTGAVVDQKDVDAILGPPTQHEKDSFSMFR